MSEYSEYFLDSGSNIVELECIEISHSDFSQIYYLVRNAVGGVTVVHEDASPVEGIEYTYYPMQITPVGSGDDLDQVLRVQLGDLGELLPAELDAVYAGDGFSEKPVMKYRTYRSDDLSAPLYGPLTFEITNLSFNRSGVSFDARAPRLNTVSTGERYTTNRFPMLRGFI